MVAIAALQGLPLSNSASLFDGTTPISGIGDISNIQGK